MPNKQAGSILPVVILIVLVAGLFLATRLVDIQQIFRSHASGISCPVITPSDLQPNITFGNAEDMRGFRGRSPLSTQFTLSWKAVPGVKSYAVRVDDGVNDTKDARNNCGPHSVCIDNYVPASDDNPTLSVEVVPGRKYTWWVHAADSLCPSSGNAYFNVNPLPPTELSSNPQGNPAGKSIFLTWKHSPSTITSYHLQLRDLSVNNNNDLFSMNCQNPAAGDKCYDVPLEQVKYLGSPDFNSTAGGKDLKDYATYKVETQPNHKYKWILYAVSQDAGRSLAVESTFSTAPEVVGCFTNNPTAACGNSDGRTSTGKTCNTSTYNSNFNSSCKDPYPYCYTQC